MSNGVNKGTKVAKSTAKASSSKGGKAIRPLDVRRRLEDRLEELRLKKELKEFDFE